MYTKLGRDAFIYWCDKCRVEAPGLMLVKVGNTLAMEVCVTCSRELLAQIRATISPEAREWYREELKIVV